MIYANKSKLNLNKSNFIIFHGIKNTLEKTFVK